MNGWRVVERNWFGEAEYVATDRVVEGYAIESIGKHWVTNGERAEMLAVYRVLLPLTGEIVTAVDEVEYEAKLL
jgi:hypothetical protein